MKLYEKKMDNCNIYFGHKSEIIVEDCLGSKSEAVNEENIMEVLVTMLMDRGLVVDGNDLVEICDSIIDLMQNTDLESYPYIEVDNGILLYVDGVVIFRDKELKYSSKKICEVVKVSEDEINETAIKLYLVRNKVGIDEKSFSYFVKSIKEYNKEEHKTEITKENMSEYIDRVPQEVMCTFLKEYFNRR